MWCGAIKKKRNGWQVCRLDMDFQVKKKEESTVERNESGKKRKKKLTTKDRGNGI